MLNSPGSSPDDAMRQSMSALMDGRLDDASLDSAFSAWRSDPKARECWHAYHLIGDVLRSDELAAEPSRDEAFLASLRSKLAAEPVPLAPGRQRMEQGQPGWRQRLVAPAAVAAGFIAVAGVLVVLRSAAPQEGAVVADRGLGEMTVVNRDVIRDARLDRYLAAHRKVSNAASVQVPGAVARSVDTVVLETK